MTTCEHLQLQSTTGIHVRGRCRQISRHFQAQQRCHGIALGLCAQRLRPLRALCGAELAAQGLRRWQLRGITFVPRVHELGQHLAMGLRG